MADSQSNNADANSADQNGGKPDDSAQTPPADANNANAEGFDTSKLTVEQLNAVLSDPRTWGNPRLKSLVESNNELKTLKEKLKTNEEKALADNKKFEELANKRGEELQQSNKTIEQLKVDQALSMALFQQSVVDTDAALKLVDRSKIAIDESGNISGVSEAIETLKSEKTYLFSGEQKPPAIGTPAPNNQQSAGPMKFKESQLTPEFYKEHEAEIDKAAAAGLIEQDGPPPSMR